LELQKMLKKFFFKFFCHLQKSSYFSHGKNVSEN
jgi:hypothetical protein